MFESAQLAHRLDDKSYKKAVAALREALLEAQFELREHNQQALVVLINGIEGAGKGETVRLLNEWMDPRLIQVSTFDIQTDEERARPPAWRYWRQLPSKGKIGVFFGNWYSQLLQGRVHDQLNDEAMDQAVDNALALEQMLCAEGVVVVKLWFHLTKTQMNARLKALKDDPRHYWRLSPLDWQQSKTYDRFVRYAERVLRRSSCDFSPWHVIDGSDENYRNLTVAKILLASLHDVLKGEPPQHVKERYVAPVLDRGDSHALLGRLDLTQRLSKSAYQAQLDTEQARLAMLMRDPRMAGQALVAVFEGNDAAGKGGAIRRVAAALDPRQYRIVPISAPTDEEREQPYLWRFWRHVPALGKFTIFDRSWYGRVLVERVEGFCQEPDWQRAYTEINDFEEQLHRAGVIVVKFWLAIDADEQLKRFKEREATTFKRYKITNEDWRNRERWDDYRLAVGEMVMRTSTALAPWTLVEANDKRFARIKVLRTINAALEQALA